ncbi:GNAT family N-acetyltransferase [Marinimicrobium sp. ABcell2]|uniref:GNAT family N-acetyltransferase n=1 Tax=Marinimicrobium sp. ABcell2 TaxID=3069751 RepID=UPI0027AF1BC5|nr:GNAT family N-acetyltransferase [Marinimicrobium sp. ABcell2]MDQ2078403.1 GNAT family N-acetyltransferase [Marinimicrobium sp. ABcell2]
MNIQPEFSPLSEEHIRGCADLFAQTFSQPPWSEDWTVELAHKRLSGLFHSAGAYGVVALVGGLAVGFALGQEEAWPGGSQFFVQEFCVHPNRHRSGIGTTLIREMEKALRNLGVRHLVLVTAQGSPAQQFYARSGFSVAEDMLVMSKELECNKN